MSWKIELSILRGIAELNRNQSFNKWNIVTVARKNIQYLYNILFFMQHLSWNEKGCKYELTHGIVAVKTNAQHVKNARPIKCMGYTEVLYNKE